MVGVVDAADIEGTVPEKPKGRWVIREASGADVFRAGGRGDGEPTRRRMDRC